MSRRDVGIACICLAAGVLAGATWARRDHGQWVRRAAHRAVVDSLEMTRAQYARDAQRWQLDRELLLGIAKGALQQGVTREEGR